MQTASAKSVVQTVATVQLSITLLGTALFAFFEGATFAGAALAGGIISMTATVYFASRVFSLHAGAPAARVARAFYIGEVLKILLTAALLSAALLWLDVEPFPLLVVYAAALMAYWLALPLTLNASARPL